MYEFSISIRKSAENIRKKLLEISREDTLVFPLFTDLHTADSQCEQTKKFLKALESLLSLVKCNGVINLGDNFSMLGREIQISNDELKKRIENLLDKIYETACVPVINVHGNHDAIGTDFFKSDFWNDCTKGKYGIENAVYGKGSYYYVDWKDSDTRFVILSVPCDSDLDGENPTPLWKFGKKQIEWVKSKALATDRRVILLCHSPLYYEYRGEYGDKMYEVWNGKEVCETHVSNLCGWIEDVEDMTSVIEDFKINNPGKLVACFSGHTHEDSLRMPHEEKDGFKNPLPCVQVVTCGVHRNEYAGEKDGFCMDVLVWTSSENALTLLRLGDGKDREIEIKE